MAVEIGAECLVLLDVQSGKSYSCSAPGAQLSHPHLIGRPQNCLHRAYAFADHH